MDRDDHSSESRPRRSLAATATTFVLVAGGLWYLNSDEGDEQFTDWFASKWGRAVCAVIMTAIALVSLYRGRTSGRWAIRSDEAPGSFGCAVLVEAAVAVGLWISLLF